MKTYGIAPVKQWICLQPSILKRRFEIQEGETPVYAMHYDIWPPLSAEVEHLIDGRKWRFKKTAWFKAESSVFPDGNDYAVGKFTATMWGTHRTIELARGERLRSEWKIWKGIHTLFNDRNEPVLRFTTRYGWGRKGEMELYAAGEEVVNRNPWLPPFYFYLIIGDGKHSST